jgi:23S rRNA (adenine2030-N6)-methyltransferase
MNYKHIYHAGNFADVLKHVILLKVLKGLKQEKKPIFVLDTHAGRGRYNLKSPEAQQSGEFYDGIGSLYKLLSSQQNNLTVPNIMTNYMQFVKKENQNNELVYYPGSPCLIQKSLRPQDRAAFCELNEKEFFKLHALLHTHKNIKLVHGDGYEALMSFIPPREKHGLVLIDPPFEQRNEIIMLEKAIITSLQRWSTGTFMLWYPIKEAEIFNKHYTMLKNTNFPNLLFELSIPDNSSYLTTPNHLKKTAVIVINPPQNLVSSQDEIHQISNFLFVKS